MDKNKFIEAMKVISHLIARRGKNIKHIICMEEFAELQQQISKHLRGKKIDIHFWKRWLTVIFA